MFICSWANLSVINSVKHVLCLVFSFFWRIMLLISKIWYFFGCLRGLFDHIMVVKAQKILLIDIWWICLKISCLLTYKLCKLNYNEWLCTNCFLMNDLVEEVYSNPYHIRFIVTSAKPLLAAMKLRPLGVLRGATWMIPNSIEIFSHLKCLALFIGLDVFMEDFESLPRSVGSWHSSDI